jgi:TonB family protein
LLRQHIRGEVVLAFIINTKGYVISPNVVTSTNSLFASAALAATKRWRYTPSMFDHHRPLNSRVRVKMTFDYEEEPTPPSVTDPVGASAVPAGGVAHL